MASDAHVFLAVIAAVRIHLFDHLKNPVTVEMVAQKYPQSDQIPELLRVLSACGFVVEREGLFVNSPLAAGFLVQNSPYSQEEYIEKLQDRLSDLWVRLPDIIRSGPVQYNKADFFSRMILPSMAANALTGRLQQVVRTIMDLPGITGASRMLDLGGGHGLYAIALARLNPGLECTVFDLPESAGICRGYIEKYDVQDRVSFVSGDFFRDDFGSGYNLILSSSTPGGKDTGMVGRICAGLMPGGYFVNVQGGDDGPERDSVSELERRMWRLSDEKKWRVRGEKKRPFLSGRYLDALSQAKMEMVSVAPIEDPFRSDAALTMIICQKPCKPADGAWFPMNMGAGFVFPPWAGQVSSLSGHQDAVLSGLKREHPLATQDCRL